MKLTDIVLIGLGVILGYLIFTVITLIVKGSECIA
jgi:hypothetical protein